MRDPSLMEAARELGALLEAVGRRFLERGPLLRQVALALVSREHLLVTGAPGTGKTALCRAVLERILEPDGTPSLYARQLDETQVKADLVGPVDFKTLQETGRVEHRVEEGILGARHALLDEVFDGREALLRSLLEVLHERELKVGTTVHTGGLEVALLTSNLHLSEVVGPRPELLLAFLDRLGFVSFVPSDFIAEGSRAALLRRAARPEPPLPGVRAQSLERLRRTAAEVEVGDPVCAALEGLLEGLSQRTSALAERLPGFVPSKALSHRNGARAISVLRAAVTLERPGDARVQVEDLALLRPFLTLGGPSVDDAEALMRRTSDPRERAQLDFVRLEQRAFDEALEALGARADRTRREVREREPAELARRSLERLGRSDDDRLALECVRLLAMALEPGPRGPSERRELEGCVRGLTRELSSRLGCVALGDPGPLVEATLETLRLLDGLERPEPLSRDRLVELAALAGESALRGWPRRVARRTARCASLDALAVELAAAGEGLTRWERLACLGDAEDFRELSEAIRARATASGLEALEAVLTRSSHARAAERVEAGTMRVSRFDAAPAYVGRRESARDPLDALSDVTEALESLRGRPGGLPEPLLVSIADAALEALFVRSASRVPCMTLWERTEAALERIERWWAPRASDGSPSSRHEEAGGAHPPSLWQRAAAFWDRYLQEQLHDEPGTSSPNLGACRGNRSAARGGRSDPDTLRGARRGVSPLSFGERAELLTSVDADVTAIHEALRRRGAAGLSPLTRELFEEKALQQLARRVFEVGSPVPGSREEVDDAASRAAALASRLARRASSNRVRAGAARLLERFERLEPPSAPSEGGPNHVDGSSAEGSYGAGAYGVGCGDDIHAPPVAASDASGGLEGIQ